MNAPLPYLIDVASSHGGPKSVAKVGALIRAQVPQLDDGELSLIGIHLIGWLHTGTLPLDVQYAWWEALDTVRAALGYDDIFASPEVAA